MFRILIIFFSLIFLTGCGTMATEQLTQRSNQGDMIEEGTQEEKNVRLETTLNIVQENEKLFIEIKLVNHGNEQVELPFNSGQQFEIIINDDHNQEVYRYSEGKMFSMALQQIELEVGQEVVWQDEWDQQVEGALIANGQYTVTAEVLVQIDEGMNVSKEVLQASQVISIGREEGTP